MFKFLVVFGKILAIACIIGVALRVIDVVFFSEKIKDNQQTVISNVSEELPEITNNQIDENKTIENTTIEETIKEETQTVSNNEYVTKKEKIKVVQTPKEETEVNKKQEQQTSITTEQKQEQKEESLVQEIITPVIEEQQAVQNNEERYVRNDEMINTMMAVINNNPSESMIAYDYTIVVDSNITRLTNQFTYTENRLTSKLNNRFGTIKIYAQDYYINNQYINTQCFIY